MKEVARHVVLSFFAVLALFGCEKTPAPPSASPPATPSPAAANLASPATLPAGESGDAEKTLHIFCWSEYIPQQIVDAFSEESGLKVSVETYSSNEEMLAKLFAGGGNYDIIQPSEYVIEGLIKEGLLTPIDHARMPNMKNLAPSLRTCHLIPATNIRFLTWPEPWASL